MRAHLSTWVAILVVAGSYAAAVATPGVVSSRASAGDGVPGGACDVAVVGAGIGGLYAAWRLAAAGGKAGVRPERVCVFEATGRTGGRILTLRGKKALPKGYDGYTVDMGMSGRGVRGIGTRGLVGGTADATVALSIPAEVGSKPLIRRGWAHVAVDHVALRMGLVFSILCP